VSDSGERIAALETQMSTLLKKVDNIEEDVSVIRTTLTQQRGFIAGMLTILAPLWGLVLFLAHKAWDNFYGASN